MSGEINIWDPATGQCVLTFPGHPEKVTDLDFSPDGKRLASAGPDGVKVWGLSPGYLATSLGGSKEANASLGAQDPIVAGAFVRSVLDGEREELPGVR